jgi:ribosomal protein S18 acetylase RimI-like enzyme
MVSVRQLEAGDVEAFRDIRLEALRESPHDFGSTYEREAEQPLERFAQSVAACTVMGRWLEDRLVAIACFQRHTYLKEQHRGLIWGVYTRPDARGRGGGRAVVKAALVAGYAEVEQIHLTVRRGNARAQRLYESLGFTSYGVEPRSYKVGDTYTDNVLMVAFRPGAGPASREPFA